MESYSLRELMFEDFGVPRKLWCLRAGRKLLSSPGVQVVFLYRIGRVFRLRGMRFVAAVIERFVLHMYGADIRTSASIGPGFCIAHPVGLVIGAKVIAGRGLSVRQNSTLGGNAGKQKDGATQPVLGDGVVMGCNSAILGPVHIGDRVRVGAGSIVISDVGHDEIVVGVPARPLVRTNQS